MIKHYFEIWLRNLIRNKILSLINIFGLSLGLACCILIILYTKDELSFDRFHKNIDRIYQLTCHRFSPRGEDKYFAIAAMVQGPAFKNAIPEINSFVRVNRQPLIVKKGNESFNETISWVDENFFTFFSFPLLSGDSKQVLNDIHSVVLSQSSSKKYFGGEDPIGKSLELEIDGKFEPFVVSGIAKNSPQNSSIQFNLLLSFKYLEEIHPDNGWMWVSYPTYFSINQIASINEVDLKMNQAFQSAAKDELAMNKLMGYTDKFIWGLEPFYKMHLNTKFEGNPEATNSVYSYILTGIAIFILLIACINFINLAIAQSLKRSKEIGLRKVIGSLRLQLFKQFLAESFFICFIAFIIALFIAQLLLPVFSNLSNKQLSLTYLLDLKLVSLFAGIFLLTAVAAGFYPAVVLSGLNPVQTLYSRAKLTGKNYFGQGLIVLQFSLAAFLIISTVFIYSQFNYLTKTNLGYNDKNLLEMTIDATIMNNSISNQYKATFAGTQGVENVTSINVGKFGGKTIANEKELNAAYLHVDENYLTAMQIALVSGRNFSKDFSMDSVNAVLVNETFIKEAGWKNGVGKTIDYMNLPGWGNRKITIAGVVKDYHFESLKEKIKPEVLTLAASLPLGKFLLRIQPTGIPSTLQALEREYKKLAPSHPFTYAFADNLNYRNYEAELRARQIISWGAFLTVLLSCVGLFGLASLSIFQRTKEIGIRKVLGSSIFQVSYLLTRKYLLLVLIAFLVAAPAALFAVKSWLNNFAYKIHITGWIFFWTGLVMMAIAVLAVSIQSIKAAMMNPVKSLRSE